MIAKLKNWLLKDYIKWNKDLRKCIDEWLDLPKNAIYKSAPQEKKPNKTAVKTYKAKILIMVILNSMALVLLTLERIGG